MLHDSLKCILHAQYDLKSRDQVVTSQRVIVGGAQGLPYLKVGGASAPPFAATAILCFWVMLYKYSLFIMLSLCSELSICLKYGSHSDCSIGLFVMI